MLRTWTLLAILLALACVCCATPALAAGEAAPNIRGADVEEEEADEERRYNWDADDGFGFEKDEVAALAMAAAVIALVVGLIAIVLGILWLVLYFGATALFVLFTIAISLVLRVIRRSLR